MASETGCHHHSSPELAPPVTGHVLPVFQTDQTSSAFMAEHSGWPPRPCLRVGELQLVTLFRSPFSFLLSCCFLPGPEAQWPTFNSSFPLLMHQGLSHSRRSGPPDLGDPDQ
ncbi:hypothetical protein CAOG_010026 [Capsaspora owczarzaki ATCC 30864]|nr:hypothetical protein CAOG_010026 [Capsaspora owczarzaki ATCC 30864]